MAIQFNCTYCDKLLKVDEKYIGRKVKCPGCQYSITVPDKSVEKQYLIRKGENTRSIAGLLDISVRTVEGYRKNIRRKVGISDKKANLKAFLQSL